MMSATYFSSRSYRLAAIGFVLVMIAAFGLSLRAQEAPVVHVDNARITGLPDDWTHHHVIFSDPGTEQDAVKNGAHERWLKTVNDPRYVIQQLKRGLPVRGPSSQDVEMRRRIEEQEGWGRDRREGRGHEDPKPNRNTSALQRDWSMNLGGTSATQTGTVSALITSITSSAGSVTITNGSNLLTMTTNATQAHATGTFAGTMTTGTITVTVAGAATSFTSTGIGTVTFSGAPGGSQTTTVGTTVYTWHASCSGQTAPCVVHSTTTTTDALNLEEAIMNTCGSSTANCLVSGTNGSATATNAGSVTTITNTTGGTIGLANSANNTAISPASGGITAPSNSCSGGTGTFIGSATQGTEASNLILAMGTCSGFYAGTGGTNAVTVTDDTFGANANTFTVGGTVVAGMFAWNGGGTVTAGTNGSTTGCTSSTTGTFELATSGAPSAATEAAGLASAIFSCNNSYAAVGATASNTAGQTSLTVTADTPGSSSITLGDSVTNFGWNGTTLAGGQAGGQASMSPAKYSFSITSAACSDYIVYPTGVTGSSSQATIAAYNYIYKTTCYSGTQTGPSVYWAYNTPNGGLSTYGAASLSPVLYSDGTQVAFIQVTAGVASLVLLRMPATGSGTVAAPVTPTYQFNGSYHGCTAPCYTTFVLNGSPNDSSSAPYYDYTGDVIYVGDNSGKLHEFTNVFKGTPAENTTSPWPVTVTSTGGLETLSSPVYDGVSGNVFIGESWSSGNHPSLVQVNSSSGAVVLSRYGPNVGFPFVGLGDAPLDVPIVDSSAKMVYSFIGNDDGGECSGGNACSAVYQLPVPFTSSTTPVEAEVGIGAGSSATAPQLYAGDFDNAYYTSTATSPTGHLYVCGNTAGNPTLYAITITGNAMGTVTTGPTLTSGAASCSPITEVANGGSDWMFLSVTANGSQTGCNGTTGANGCVYSFNVASGVPGSASAGLAAAGGTSGIVIDNTSVTNGASEIYYTTLSGQSCNGNGTFTGHSGSGAGGCAVQTTQSGLQ